MQIEASLAQNIVASMKEIIDQEINFFDTDSTIIASTDESRIGNSHGGAKKVIETKSDLVIEYDGQYGGTKKGINIPVYADRQLIGVIGITGEKKEVEKYGEIIKKMTEILIKDAWLKDVSFKKRENYRIFLEQLLSKSPNSENIQQLANILEIDLTIPRIAVVGMIQNFSSAKDEQIEQLMNLIHRTLSNDQQHFFHLNGAEIRIILDAKIDFEKVQFLLNTIIQSAKEKLDLDIYLGVGNICEEMKAVKKSYQQALTALNWGVVNLTTPVEYYDELDLGIVLTNLPLEVETHYIEKILGELSEKELEEYNEILSIYGEKNGSIYKTADELFIHNNTLQYKLIKLKKLTGYDPRELNDYVILSLAFRLLNMIQAENRIDILKNN